MDLDQMSIMMHKRTSTRQCDLIRVSYDERLEEFVVVDAGKKRSAFRERKDCEKHISRHYRAVRENLDEGCHH